VSVDARPFLRSLFDAAVAAVDPARALAGRLPPPPPGRTVVVGAGKAAAAMARAVEREWRGPLGGLIVTRYGHGVPCEHIQVMEAAHPLPDEASHAAAVGALDLVRDLGHDDLVLCLLSGGGSSLWSLPTPDVTLSDKQAVSRLLLRSGATISEINCVRKHISLIKGGRLALAAHPARVVTYMVSDVPGDDPAVIASGPTVPDPTTFADAVAIIERYGITEPSSVVNHLRWGEMAGGEAGERVGASETPKPGDPGFARDEVVMLGTAGVALDAAHGAAKAAGITAIVLGDDLEGEARDLGGGHAALTLALLRGGEHAVRGLREAVERGWARMDVPSAPPAPPFVLLSGGETSVTVTGGGRGGRNLEYLLGLAIALDGAPGVTALAADTDGIDGTEDHAGAFVLPDSLVRARDLGLEPFAALAENDVYPLFATLGDLLVTGPTFTNVNDFRAILVQPES
jgi:hydroxypyruvate reductase